MSVDLLLYRANKLSDEDVKLMTGKNYDSAGSWDNENGEVKCYLVEDVEKKAERYAELMPYFTKVTMAHTTTDYKSCFRACGMPENVTSYSFQSLGWGFRLRFDGETLDISGEQLDKFTKTELTDFYVYRRLSTDVDVSSWCARTLKDKMQEDMGIDDLSYRPVQFVRTRVGKVCETLVREYDEGNLYSGDEVMRLLCEIMRIVVNPEENIFIEFQT